MPDYRLMTEEERVDRINDYDRGASTELLGRYQKLLLRRFSREDDEVEELVQELMLRVPRCGSKLSLGSARAWLFDVANDVGAKLWGLCLSGQQPMSVYINEDGRIIETQVPDRLIRTADETLDPDDLLIGAIDSLSSAERKARLLSVVEELSGNPATGVLGVSPERPKEYLARASRSTREHPSNVLEASINKLPSNHVQAKTLTERSAMESAASAEVVRQSARSLG